MSHSYCKETVMRDVLIGLRAESKNVFAFGGLWNKKYVTDIQNDRAENA